jgi:hypothetical protein
MLLWIIYIILIISNLVVAIVRWQKLRSPIKRLAWLLGWVLFIELVREFGKESLKPFFTHINLTTELLFLFFYFKSLLHKKKFLFLYGGLAFHFTALYVAWVVDPSFFTNKNFLDGMFMDICVTTWTVLFFYELIQKPLQYNINLDGSFWVNCGHVLYYPGTLLLFGLNSYLKDISPDLWTSLRPLNYGLNLTLYSLYLVAFLMDKKRKSNLF